MKFSRLEDRVAALELRLNNLEPDLRKFHDELRFTRRYYWWLRKQGYLPVPPDFLFAREFDPATAGKRPPTPTTEEA